MILWVGATPVKTKLVPPDYDLDLEAIAAAITPRQDAAAQHSSQSDRTRLLRRIPQDTGDDPPGGVRASRPADLHPVGRGVQPIGDDVEFARRLRQDSVLVLPCSTVDLPGYFRISLTATDKMIDRALPVFAAHHR